MNLPDALLYLIGAALMAPTVIKWWRQRRRERRQDAEFVAWFKQRQAGKRARADAGGVPRPALAPDDDQAWLDRLGARIAAERER